MSYTPYTWVDRVAANPGQFTATGTVPGTVTLVLNDTPSVTGTALTAARMNHIETGISTEISIEASTRLISDTVLSTNLSTEVSSRIAETLTATKTYYVNKSGNDNNDGLTVGNGFLTFAKALSMLPKHLQANVTIIIGAGTYFEYMNLYDYWGSGTFLIVGPVGAGSTCIFSGINTFACKCQLVLSDLKSISVNAYDCSDVNFGYMYPTNGIVTVDSIGYINACVISNTSIAIDATRNSYITINGNSGNTNTVVLKAETGSTIVKNGAVGITGVTPESAITGGLIR